MELMNFSIYQTSHIGNRKYNQDRVAYAYSKDALLLVLADGMGGHLNGELAASLTIDTFVETFGFRAERRIGNPTEFLADTMSRAHERILNLPHDEEMGGFPGTTCVAVLIQDNTMYWGYAGDSRVYLLRNDEVEFRSRDHSLVQYWVDQGMLTDEQARVHEQRNQITNCLGGMEGSFYMEPGRSVPLNAGDAVLLGSDGLWGPFTDEELASAFINLPVEQGLDDLVAIALQREQNHSDNVTGIVIRWGEGESLHETVDPVSHILEIL